MSAGGTRTISLGALLGVIGALLLLVSLFLDWYARSSGEGATAFTVFELLDLLLAGLSIATLVSLADRLGVSLPRHVALSSTAALPLAVLALLIVISQLLNHPPAAIGPDLEPDVGLWLALAGSALMLCGAILRSARVSLAVDAEPGQGSDAASGGTAAPAPGGMAGQPTGDSSSSRSPSPDAPTLRERLAPEPTERPPGGEPRG